MLFAIKSTLVYGLFFLVSKLPYMESFIQLISHADANYTLKLFMKISMEGNSGDKNISHNNQKKWSLLLCFWAYRLYTEFFKWATLSECQPPRGVKGNKILGTDLFLFSQFLAGERRTA